MSTTQPAAASLAEIKAAFPRAKAEFLVRCLEKNLPMASVMTEALAAMEEELMQAKAKLAEYESAKEEEPMAMEEEDEPSAEMEEEEEKPMAKAKAKPRARNAHRSLSGVKPVVKPTQGSSSMSAKAAWTAKITEKVKSGMSRAQAIKDVDAESPSLREQMIAEVNS